MDSFDSLVVNAPDFFLHEMLYAILVLSFVLFIIRIKRQKDGDIPLENGLHMANWILLLLISLLEIFYIVSLGKDSIWFCNPYQVGWLWTIINFLTFAFVVSNQLLSYLNTLRDVQYNSYASFSWKWGLYSWPIALGSAIICGLFYQNGLIIVGALFLIVQLVQIVIIFKNVVPKGGWGHAILFATIYLLGAAATSALLVHFLVLLIIVLVVLFIVFCLGGGAGESISTKSETIKCPECGVTYNRWGSPNCVCQYYKDKAQKEWFEKNRGW